MKKKFEFKISKETIVNLTENQLKSIVGGDATGFNTSCISGCEEENPTTLGLDCDGGYTIGSDCPTQSCVPGTSYAAGCTGSNTTTVAGCNTSESNCISTNACGG